MIFQGRIEEHFWRKSRHEDCSQKSFTFCYFSKY